MILAGRDSLTQRSSHLGMSAGFFRGIILQRTSSFATAQIRTKFKNVDYSRFPTLNEDDLEEQFVRGSGPGGQAVNKTSNCCVLRHKPTNILVKCHIHRVASRNREEARKILLTKLDNMLNGEMSIESQTKAIESKKIAEKTRKRNKLREMKERWKAGFNSGNEE